MKNNIDIIMLGDSLIGRGEWQELLKPYHTLNLGCDGDTTMDIITRLDKVFLIKPKYLFLLAGINDINHSVKIETVFLNYKTILEKLKENSINVIVQTTIYTTMPALNKKVKILNSLLFSYCKEEKIDIIDLNSKFTNDNGLLREELTTDGLHLGIAAYKVWAYIINQYLK